MMKKRDLKADLELFNRATPGPWEFGPIYAGTIAGELDEERHRANRELLNNFREGWPHAIERAIEAEALARELVEVLKKHEQWEADFILDDKAWATVNGLPQFTQEVYDAWLEFQTVRNKVLVKTKEVLGDD
jgi:hypothetical protein